MTERLLTESEVAQRLEIKKSCLRRWRRERRELPFVRVGTRIRYRESALQEFIEQCTVGVAGKERRTTKKPVDKPNTLAYRIN